VARMAVRRRTWPWTKVLHEAGLLGDGYRTSRGVVMVAADEHLCLSMLEKAVDDFLFKNGIKHEREPLYPYDPDLNPRTLRRADFHLADGTLVEAWGFPEDPVYAAKMVEKKELAARHKIRVLGLTAADLPRLPEKFARWLVPGVPVDPAWIPPVPVARERKPADPTVADPRGGYNAVSKANRDERLERCREAVLLQGAGLTRSQIAEKLGVGADSVKGFLRDGKFYADPMSDPARYALAEHAATARKEGIRKSEYKATSGLSMSIGKITEVWRDADVLFGANDLEGGD
jgi:hypothetical protein